MTVMAHCAGASTSKDACHNASTSKDASHNAGFEDTYGAMLYKWQSDPDIQEAERGLYALPWAPTADLLRQTLNISFAGQQEWPAFCVFVTADLGRTVGQCAGTTVYDAVFDLQASCSSSRCGV